jgi:hypothetical protein
MEGSQRQEKGKGKASDAGTSTFQSTGMRSRQARGDKPLAGQVREPKERKPRNVKLGSKPREGVTADKNFPYVSQIVSKSHICNKYGVVRINKFKLASSFFTVRINIIVRYA